MGRPPEGGTARSSPSTDAEPFGPRSWGGRLRARFLPTATRFLGVGDGLAGATMTVAVGTASAQLVATLASPVLTRLYSPQEFGVYAAGFSLVSILVVGASLRYEAAIPLAPDDRTAASLVVLSTFWTLATTFVLALACFVFASTIAEDLGAPGLAPILPLVVLSELGAAFYAIASSWALRARAFGALAATRLRQGLGMAGVQIGCGLLGAGAPGLLAGDVVGRSAGVWGLSRGLLGDLGGTIRGTRLADVRESAARYRRFPLYSAPSAMLNAASLQAPTLLLVALYGPQAGGLFVLAQRVGSIPIRLVSASVAQVYYSDASRRARVDRPSLPALYFATIRRLAVLGLVPAALLATAPVVFPIVFGPAWGTAGWYALILAPMFYALFVWNAISGTFDALERQHLALISETISILAMVAVGVGARLAGADTIVAVALLSATLTLGTALAIALSWHAVRSVGVPPRAVDEANA